MMGWGCGGGEHSVVARGVRFWCCLNSAADDIDDTTMILCVNVGVDMYVVVWCAVHVHTRVMGVCNFLQTWKKFMGDRHPVLLITINSATSQRPSRQSPPQTVQDRSCTQPRDDGTKARRNAIHNQVGDGNYRGPEVRSHDSARY